MRYDENITNYKWKAKSYRRQYDGEAYINWIPMTYTNWNQHYNQPDNSKGHEWCLNLWPNVDYTWNDVNCGLKYCFVCEHRDDDHSFE